jgi:hypothetical protein
MVVVGGARVWEGGRRVGVEDGRDARVAVATTVVEVGGAMEVVRQNRGK